MIEALLPVPTFLVSLSGVMNWSVGFFTTIAILGIVTLGLNIQWGYTGVFNFGIAAFLMVGAYTSALLTLPPAGDFQSYQLGLQLPVVVGWLGGAAAGAVLAFLIGMPTLRLRGDFLAIATIGMAAILRTVANTSEGLVNRARGLNGIPRFMGDYVEPSDYRWVLLATCVVALALVYLLVRAVTQSPWGRVLRAIRDNEATAQAAGKATVPYRMQSFVLGGAIMGFAGALWAHRVGTIAPDSFSDLFGTFFIWTMLIVGGSGNHLGAVVGTLVVGFFWFGTPLIQEDLPKALGTQVFVLRQFAIGLLVVAFILWLPKGLVPEQAPVSRFAPTAHRSALDRLRARLGGGESAA
ncbi:MAG: branched-chain amino acid ABC transporter permease [Chloroflexi bacterium]|nr:branched-chain amino acid ABC transporter permease [Chloroflexota bacterium]MDA1239603.1 branched-chain amino acid ABC transporter permease [Chloroflexota bacterium]